MKPALILFALLLAGCASEPVPIEFPVSPTMATSYAHGETSISWEANVDETYTIYFTDAPSGKLPDWKPLPQANNLKGTGQKIIISDTVAPEKIRRYILLTGMQRP